MATAREKNGKWYYRITVSSQGKRKYLERGSYRTKKEAIEAGTEHELKLKSGDKMFVPERSLTEIWQKNGSQIMHQQCISRTQSTLIL